MNFRDWKISAQLVAIMLGLGLLVAFVIGGWSGYSAFTSLGDEIRMRNEAVLEIKSHQIESWYQNRFADIEVLSGTDDVHLMYERLFKYHVDNHVGATDPFPASGTEYASIWAQGEKLERYVELYGYYDLFIICKAHGHVMYTTAKESDLGANLAVGSLKSSGLAECWKAVCDNAALYCTDWAAYEPRDGSPSQFVGFPMYYEGEFKAVVILQVPLASLDTVMQDSAGMGTTGETYLVGQDRLLRNNSRLAAANGDANTCLKLKADTDQVAKGLNDEEGFLIGKNYAGVPSLAAFGTVNVQNNKWAIISEISKAEAYAPINKMVMAIGVAIVVLSVLVILIAMATGKSIGSPLARIAEVCKVMSTGDFTVDIEKSTSKNEIGQMLTGFNAMKQNTSELIRHVADAAHNVAASSEELSAGADETSRATEEVARTVDEVAKGAADTTSNVETVSEAVTAAMEIGEKGKEFASETAGIIQRTAQSVEDTSQTISTLSERTNQIASFISIITGIADQTNLLALNAAIEAARAGEAGRGFAVVAEEVRKLAEESNSAAGNITELVKSIEGEMKSALSAMDRCNSEAAEGAKMVNQTSDMLNEIVVGVDSLGVRVQTIASIATENAAAAEEVSSSSQQQTASMQEIGASAQTLASLATDMQSLVSQFKVEASPNGHHNVDLEALKTK